MPILLVAILASVGCGTQVPHDDVVAATFGGPNGTDQFGSSGAGAGNGTSGGEAPTGTSVGTGADGDASSIGGPTEPGSELGADAPSGNAVEVGGGQGETIRIGTSDNYSGIAAATTIPGRDTLLAWAAATNAAGGINGHPVEVVVRDGGTTDQTQGVAIRRLIEEDHVDVLIWASPSKIAHADYITSMRVPVLGEIDIRDAPSPMYFTTASNVAGNIFGFAAGPVSFGNSRLAVLYCAETPECRIVRDELAGGGAAAAGASVEFESQISVAQPDFTAECISSRSNDVQAILVLADEATVARVAASCNRQGYNPQMVGTAMSEAILADNPLLEGSIQNINAFPWRGTTPGIQRFQQAMATYAPGVRPNMIATTNWTSAEFLRAALAGIGPTDPIDSETVLEGLWSLQPTTLDGLTARPISFAREMPNTGIPCNYILVAEGNQFVPANNGEPVCL